MANTKFTGLGEITSNYLLNDFTAYIMNTSATGAYSSTDWAVIGYTSPEKTINPINEKFRAEVGIPRVENYSKTIRKGLEVGFSLLNFNPEFNAVVRNSTIVSLGSTGVEYQNGTSEPATQYRAIRLVAQRDDNKYYAITIPKCEISQDGEQTVGGEENTVMPLLLSAKYNPSASATKNVYYENLWSSNISPTADVPPGFA